MLGSPSKAGETPTPNLVHMRLTMPHEHVRMEKFVSHKIEVFMGEEPVRVGVGLE